jgi:hypothetical protein
VTSLANGSHARQIGECGIPRVSLTGSEPLVRHDFIEILGRDPIICSFFKDGWAQKVVEVVRDVRSTATLKKN